METPGIPETLPEGPPRTAPPPEAQTLETPGGSGDPPPPRDGRGPESRVSRLGSGVPPSEAGGENPPAVTNAGGMEGASELPVTDYAPAEFLERLRDAALGVPTADARDGVMLRNWAAAFLRGKGCVVDLNASDPGTPLGASISDKPEDDLQTIGVRVVNGPEVTEGLDQRKKKRSMAELIAGMDLGMVEPGDDETNATYPDLLSPSESKKKGDNGKDSDLDDGDGVTEGGAGSGRRERKKSKYLSPPYTNSSGSSKRTASPNDAEMETLEKDFESPRATVVLSPLILECDSRIARKVQDPTSPLLKYDCIDVNLLLSEFLSTAIDPLHLKWNRSAKAVRGFFAEFRSSMYASVSDFENHGKHLGDSGSVDGNFVDVEMGDAFKEGKSVRKRNKRNDGANGKSLLDLSHDTTDHSRQGKARQRRKMMKEQRRKMMKDGANGESSMDLAHVTNGVEGESRDKMKKSKDGANRETVVGLSGHKLTNCSEVGLPRKRNTRKGVANGGTPAVLDCELIGGSKVGNVGQKRKTSNTKPNGGPQIGSYRKMSNGSEGGRSRQKRKIEEALSGSPAALLLTFTPGTTLPSKDELISAFSPYGDLVKPRTELLKDSSSARVVFARSCDAEKVFNSPDKKNAFGFPVASCRLRYLPENLSTPSSPQPVKKSPLPCIRRSLARMISMLTKPSSLEKDAGPPRCLKLEGMEDLVADMKGLLEKVDKLVTKPPAGTSP